ncbi:U3-containing 90S pre-ribosomal complex subunit-domain containing protein [Mycena belliarum]|uniref:U3-containing 90S pre-ribosomal complex subunit-domain containing protein n=1 Tax=Mycena belliarum TaxID=1033014 RepID=A0AAD6UEB7_9AGAR|nr:U3-containing 90S pre-ribosomal complex subunit-domain containing protein [Mycena belliae]
MSGDALEDNLLLDHDILALSDEGDASSDEHDPMSAQSEGLEEPESSKTPNLLQNDKKRKRREKEREKFKEKKKRKLAANESGFERSIADQSPQDLAEYLSALQAKAFPKMSAIELGDLHIPCPSPLSTFFSFAAPSTHCFPAHSIADTSIWTGPRTLDNLVDFVVKVLPNLRLRLSQRSKTSGAPTLIFVAGAALRVVDVTRVLKDNKLRGEKGGEVAKLFAKHFKLAEHVTYLRRTKVGSAVGTPGRIGKLLCETDALTVSALSHIILDVSFRDAKKRSMLDIPETRDEVFKTVLGAPKVLQAIKEGKIQVVLF